jgi:hypothetical protein
MQLLRYLSLLLASVFLILHGFAHSLGVLGSWNLMTFDDLSRQPNFWLTSAGDELLFVLGFFWLLAAVSFIAAGIGMLRHSFWWPTAVAFALVISVPMTLLWHNDAFIGIVLNGLIMAAMALWYLLNVRQEGQFA